MALTQEQKSKRSENKRLKKEKQEAKREQDHREASIVQIRAEFIPPPTRIFALHEKVKFGGHQETEIIEIFDNGIFYEVLCTGVVPRDQQNAGSPIYVKHMVEWLSLFKITTNTEVLSKKNDFNLRYMQQTIESLLHRTYHFGVDFNAKYQRELVWTNEDKVLLIDSIMVRRDIGKFLFTKLPYEDGGPYLQIVDGKQRLTTICDYYTDKFKWKERFYSELSIFDRRQFTDKTVNVGEVDNMPKTDILKLFLFVNDTGKPISKSHLEKVKKMLENGQH